jgi:hypothetical protein
MASQHATVKALSLLMRDQKQKQTQQKNRDFFRQKKSHKQKQK